MPVVVIGGGIAGLSAAINLGSDVMVIEPYEIGGALSSFNMGSYHIEKFYHHCFEGDTELFQTMKHLGMEEMEWHTARIGYFFDGEVFPLNTPVEILRYPKLSLLDKVRLARMVLKLKKIERVEVLDNVGATEWILENGSRTLYTNFFQPLLTSKFGGNIPSISAAWLAGRVNIRSTRTLKGEKLGYPKGGFHRLISSMSEKIKENGGEILKEEAIRIDTKDGKVRGVETDQDYHLSENVVSTVPPGKLNGLIDQMLDLDKIRYQGTLCFLMGLKEPLLSDTYWLNIKGDFPFGAIIEHTNFLPAKQYGGEHLIYVVAYVQGKDDPLWKQSDRALYDIFLEGLCRINPGFSRDQVCWHRITRSLESAPIYDLGYHQRILPYRTDVHGLFTAGTFSISNYPERSINGSLVAGKMCAEAIQSQR